MIWCNFVSTDVVGNEGTPYAGGVFELDITITDRYPFEPPKFRFLTPIFHPNIDEGGRICLDTLKMPPQVCYIQYFYVNMCFIVIFMTTILVFMYIFLKLILKL